MGIYKIGQRLNFIKELPFKFEKDIQTLVEKNLKSLLHLDFIRSEFALNGFRIDTLAFDTETKSFVIVEYKRDKNFSVIDQGYAYLSLMLNNKADFILEFNESQQTTLKRTDVDWTQSKVIFISPQFTNYQREAINFKDLPIELWEIKRFENDTVSFDQIQKTSAKESTTRRFGQYACTSYPIVHTLVSISCESSVFALFLGGTARCRFRLKPIIFDKVLLPFQRTLFIFVPCGNPGHKTASNIGYDAICLIRQPLHSLGR